LIELGLVCSNVIAELFDVIAFRYKNNQKKKNEKDIREVIQDKGLR
jgi:hypothetical protein